MAKVRRELDAKWHVYQKRKRVCAQKPFDDKVKPEAKVEVTKLASDSEEDKPDAKMQNASPETK